MLRARYVDMRTYHALNCCKPRPQALSFLELMFGKKRVEEKHGGEKGRNFGQFRYSRFLNLTSSLRLTIGRCGLIAGHSAKLHSTKNIFGLIREVWTPREKHQQQPCYTVNQTHTSHLFARGRKLSFKARSCWRETQQSCVL